MSWIRQKDEEPTRRPDPRADAGETRAARAEAAERVGRERVHIGPSMEIRGELRGNEDLTIDGLVEGKIYLNGHRLTVARNGKIRAEVRDAACLVVHGEMVGNVQTSDRVEVASTGSMLGDIRAPRVVLADGARFKGSIDMSPDPAAVKPQAREMREARETREEPAPEPSFAATR